MEFEIVDLGELALDLQSDGLHYNAENDLGAPAAATSASSASGLL
jgi:hypothetical protein